MGESSGELNTASRGSDLSASSDEEDDRFTLKIISEPRERERGGKFGWPPLVVVGLKCFFKLNKCD